MADQKVEYTWPWERAAMRGDEMPDGLSEPEQKAFQLMALLAQRFNRGEIKREQATEEKGKIKYQLQCALNANEANDSLISQTVKLWKNIELAHSDYRKARNAGDKDGMAQAAERMSRVLDGMER